METAGLSWGGRAGPERVVGPITCEHCLWSGTFWLLAVDQRRRKARWRSVGLRPGTCVLVCRNCAQTSEAPVPAAPLPVASAGPVLVADPIAPLSEAHARDTRSPGV